MTSLMSISIIVGPPAVNGGVVVGSAMFVAADCAMIYVRGSGGVGVPSLPISDRAVDDVRPLLMGIAMGYRTSIKG